MSEFAVIYAIHRCVMPAPTYLERLTFDPKDIAGLTRQRQREVANATIEVQDPLIGAHIEELDST